MRYIVYQSDFDYKKETISLLNSQQEPELEKRHTDFVNVFLEDLNNMAIAYELYGSTTGLSKEELIKRIVEGTKHVWVIYEAKELFHFCVQTHFFQRYFRDVESEDDDVHNWIGYIVYVATAILRNCKNTSSFELSQLFRNIIAFCHIQPYKANVRKPLSYTWISNPDEELPALFQKMIDAGLIAQGTDQQNFIKVFTGQPLDEITQVHWLNTQKLLAYFISKVTNRLPADDLRGYWKIAESCFYPANNLKQSHNNNKNLDEDGRPEDHHLVDDLFE